MFVGRQKELNEINKLWSSNKPELLIIYGRRRIGKTTLIKKAMEDKCGVYFLARRDRLEAETMRLKEKLSLQLDMPVTGNSLEEIFSGLIKRKKERFMVVIDEFPYLAMKDKRTLSVFQSLWDETLKDSNIMLVLMGSFMSFMISDVAGHGSPLYGRGTAFFDISPLEIKDLYELFPEKSPEEIIETYGVIDTVPYYMAMFDANISLKENIRNTFLNPVSPMYHDAENVLSSELREFSTYLNIMKAVIDGKTKLSEIAQASSVDITNISKYISILEKMNMIKRIRPAFATQKNKSHIFEVCDNYMRFWLSFVYPFREEIELDPEGHMQHIMENMSSYMGRVFETFVMRTIKESKESGYNAVYRWWHKENEIDIVGIKTGEKKILFGECKWKENVDGFAVLEALKKKALNVRFPSSYKNIEYAVFAKSFKQKETGMLDIYDLKEMAVK